MAVARSCPAGLPAKPVNVLHANMPFGLSPVWYALNLLSLGRQRNHGPNQPAKEGLPVQP